MKRFSCVFIIFIMFFAISGVSGYALEQDKTQETDFIIATEVIPDSTEAETDLPDKDGFFEESGKIYYYKNGEKYIGLLKFEGNVYYFNESGEMRTGLTKIENDRYYFGNNGKMQIGLVKIDERKYYFNKVGKMKTNCFVKMGSDKYFFGKDGEMQTGIVTIKNNKYFFGKTGKMKTGLKTIDGKRYLFSKKTGKMMHGFKKYRKQKYYFNHKNGVAHTGFLKRTFRGRTFRTFYDDKGRLKRGTFTVDNVQYKSTKSIGEIYSYRLLSPALCQRPNLPTGCEIVSWTMMANYAGVKIDKFKAAEIMPKSSNPNRGFMGSPFSSYGYGLVVYPDGLKSMTIKYLGSYNNLTGCSLNEIKHQLSKKHIVMAWVYGLDGFSSHTIALTGYEQNAFFYNDPWTGTSRKIDNETFMKMWMRNSKRAMSY